MTVAGHFSGKVSILFLLVWICPFTLVLAQDEITDEELEALLADDDALEAWLEEEFSGWDFNAFSRLGWGYSDNVLLATVNPQTGNYLRTDVELFLSKLPDEKGEFLSFISGSDLRYSGVEGADKEMLWLFDSEWKRYLSDKFNGMLKAQYVYFDQIIDLSLSERQESATRQRIQYHGYGLGSGLEYLPGGSNTFSFEAMLTREEFAQVLGQDWLGRLELAWERPVWKGAEITTKILAEKRDYDDRYQRNPLNFREIEDAPLKVNRTSASIELSQGWGKSELVTTALETRYLQNRDNGSGFYDYNQWTIDFSLDAIWNSWETTLVAGLDDTKFPIQPIERFSTTLRKKTDYWAEFFVRKKIMKRISLYLLLEYEESQSNVEGDDYDALSGTLGFQLDIWGES